MLSKYYDLTLNFKDFNFVLLIALINARVFTDDLRRNDKFIVHSVRGANEIVNYSTSSIVVSIL